MTERSNDDNIPGDRKARPVITFDYSLYDHYFEDAELTEDQKRVFLETMWNLIVELMSLGFDIHPVQQVQNTCGELSETRTNPPNSGADRVDSDDQIQRTQFKEAAEGSTEKVVERIPE